MQGYMISYYLGYFLIMIVCSVLAIIFARRKAGWILFGVGAVLQGMSLIGRQMSLNQWGLGNTMSTSWSIYAILAIGTAVIIYIRRNKF